MCPFIYLLIFFTHVTIIMHKCLLFTFLGHIGNWTKRNTFWIKESLKLSLLGKVYTDQISNITISKKLHIFLLGFPRNQTASLVNMYNKHVLISRYYVPIPGLTPHPLPTHTAVHWNPAIPGWQDFLTTGFAASLASLLIRVTLWLRPAKSR